MKLFLLRSFWGGFSQCVDSCLIGQNLSLAPMQVLAGEVPIAIKSVPVTKEERENACQTGTSRFFDWMSGSDSASASLTRPF